MGACSGQDALRPHASEAGSGELKRKLSSFQDRRRQHTCKLGKRSYKTAKRGRLACTLYLGCAVGAFADADAAAAPGLPRLCELVPLAGAFTFPTPPLDTPGGPLTGVTQSACLLEHCAGTLGCNSALFLPSAQSCVLYRETLDEVGMDASDPGYESEALLLYCRQDAALPPPAPTAPRIPTVSLPRDLSYGRLAFRTQCGAVLTARLDPITSPGVVSGHMHTAFGNANFGATVDPQRDLLAPVPTTCNVPFDRSMYWAPTLYARDPETRRFNLVPSFAIAYYLANAYTYMAAGNSIHAYPLGLRMIQGDFTLRSGAGDLTKAAAASEAASGRNPEHSGSQAESSLATLAAGHQSLDRAKWYCQARGPTGSLDRQATPYDTFPGLATSDGAACVLWQAVLWFPTCWDGANLDSADHKSHVAYTARGVCPPSHPFLLPQLKFEVVFRLQPVIDAAARAGVTLTIDDFVLSTGDSSGASMHADFISGWNATELAGLMAGCDEGVSGAGGACIAARYADQEPPSAGDYASTQLVPDEPVDNLEALPVGAVPLVERRVESGRVSSVTGLWPNIPGSSWALLACALLAFWL